jgi:hypothetical protein
MRARRIALGAVLGAAAAFTACDLNPQPLPPLDPEAAFSPGQDAGAHANDASTPPKNGGNDAGASDDRSDGGAEDGGAEDGGPTEDGGEDAGDAG